MTLDLHIISDSERQARDARAKLRALELKTGQSADDAGAYWLERVVALEHVAAAARDTQDFVLQEALDRLDSVRAPMCRIGDHACPAA